MAFVGAWTGDVREDGLHGTPDFATSDEDDDHKIVPGDIRVRIYAIIIMDKYFLITTCRGVVALAAAV
jgi:hypothetical protein